LPSILLDWPYPSALQLNTVAKAAPRGRSCRGCSPRIVSRRGWAVEQAAWRLGVSAAIYREIESGERWPTWEAFDRICQTFGRPQTFVAGGRSYRRRMG
jgi:hypothetical protein